MRELPEDLGGDAGGRRELTQRDSNGVPRRRGFDFDWPAPGAYWLTLNSLMHQRGANLGGRGSLQGEPSTDLPPST